MKSRIFNASETTPEILGEACAALKRGAVIILPTDTVYGIASSADSEEGTAKIYLLKNRRADTPLQLLLPSLSAARELAEFDQKALALADKYWPGEMTLILPPAPEGQKYLRHSASLGLRVPAHPLAQRLLNTLRAPLRASSANTHGDAPLKTEEEILNAFNGKAEYIFLDGTIETQSSAVVQTAPFKILRPGRYKTEDLLKN